MWARQMLQVLYPQPHEACHRQCVPIQLGGRVQPCMGALGLIDRESIQFMYSVHPIPYGNLLFSKEPTCT